RLLGRRRSGLSSLVYHPGTDRRGEKFRQGRVHSCLGKFYERGTRLCSGTGFHQRKGWCRMAVTIKVNNLTLAHKGSDGLSIATLPDVCLTPPVPVALPYPNITFSKDLDKGTTTVSADGGNMIAIKGSEFSRSIGDEAGASGGVMSAVNMKEST